MYENWGVRISLRLGGRFGRMDKGCTRNGPETITDCERAWPLKYFGLEPFRDGRRDWKIRCASVFQTNETGNSVCRAAVDFCENLMSC